MRVNIYWLEEQHKLGIMARPRGGDWLDDEMLAVRNANVDAVVSLLTSDEIVELDLTREAESCRLHQLKFLSFPIPDRNVPILNSVTTDFIYSLAAIIRSGKTVVIHCRQGVGRSALIAAAIMVVQGQDANEVFTKIAAARGCVVPDTLEQRHWVSGFAGTLR